MPNPNCIHCTKWQIANTVPKIENLCSHIFVVLRDHGVYMFFFHLKMEFRSCARGVRGVALFITTDERLQ